MSETNPGLGSDGVGATQGNEGEAEAHRRLLVFLYFVTLIARAQLDEANTLGILEVVSNKNLYTHFSGASRWSAKVGTSE